MSIRNMAEYQRARRWHGVLRAIAMLGVLLAVLIITFGIGTLLGAWNNRNVTLLIAGALAWGIWGGCYLNDRH